MQNCVIDVSENNTSTYLPIIDCLMRNRREKEPNEDIENVLNMSYFLLILNKFFKQTVNVLLMLCKKIVKIQIML